MSQLVDLKREVKTRQRAGVAVAAAVVLVVLAGAFFATTRLLGSDDTSLPAGPSRTDRALGIATDLFAAYDDNDAEGMLALMTRDAITPEWTSADNVRDDARWREAVGWAETQRRCAQSGEPVGDVFYLRCDFALHALGSEQLGRGPFEGGYWAVHVQRGKVNYLTSEFPFSTNGFATEMWEPFEAFVSENYPDDHGTMYEDEGAEAGRQDSHSLQLWTQHIADYVRSESAS
jgi:hypothetical protein